MTAEALRALVPRLTLALLFFAGSGFAFFESVYLGDQARMIGDAKIEFWMWAFRATAAFALVVSGAFGFGALITRDL
jgi:hypothetical protein